MQCKYKLRQLLNLMESHWRNDTDTSWLVLRFRRWLVALMFNSALMQTSSFETSTCLHSNVPSYQPGFHLPSPHVLVQLAAAVYQLDVDYRNRRHPISFISTTSHFVIESHFSTLLLNIYRIFITLFFH